MNILILGRGYVGSYLKKYLETLVVRSDRLDVRVVRRSETDYSTISGFHELLDQQWVDFVVNCSGYTGVPNVDACEDAKDLCWDLNVTVPNRIAQICTENSIPFGQVSSGCIYTGYDEVFTEKDVPNFGLYDTDSSFYSKSKHACELALNDKESYIWRIRMPFCNTWSHKNILNKIYKYDNLISLPNSLTSIDNLCEYIGKFIERSYTKDKLPVGIYNVVNDGAMEASTIVDMMRARGISNDKWSFIPYEELDIRAHRSNCVLSQDKNKKYGVELPDAVTAVEEALERMSKVTI